MADELHPGRVDLDEFAHSMAAAIEDELNAALRDDDLRELPGGDSAAVRDRRRLFVAIARGVVGHLAAHPEAWHIEDGENRRCTVRELRWD